MGDEVGAWGDRGWRDRQKVPAGEAAAAPAPTTEDRSPLSVGGGSPSVSSAPAGMTADEALDVLREARHVYGPWREKASEATGVLAAELKRLREAFATEVRVCSARTQMLQAAERDLAVARKKLERIANVESTWETLQQLDAARQENERLRAELEWIVSVKPVASLWGQGCGTPIGGGAGSYGLCGQVGLCVTCWEKAEGRHLPTVMVERDASRGLAERYETALRYYADTASWRQLETMGTASANLDRGKRARDALRGEEPAPLTAGEHMRGDDGSDPGTPGERLRGTAVPSPDDSPAVSGGEEPAMSMNRESHAVEQIRALLPDAASMDQTEADYLDDALARINALVSAVEDYARFYLYRGERGDDVRRTLAALLGGEEPARTEGPGFCSDCGRALTTEEAIRSDACPECDPSKEQR